MARGPQRLGGPMQPLRLHRLKAGPADACRLSALKFKRKAKGYENKKHFYMQNFPSIVFQMFAL